MPSDSRWRPFSAPVIGWVFYDFANTIFSFVVVTRYFNDWLIEERGQPDIYVGLMTAVVSLALVATLPLIGARADREGRHMPILISFSILCCAMTALLGVVDPVWLTLVVAGVATYAFNTADSQYHPLLAVVAPERSRGRISGLGVSLGFVGSLVALFALGAYVDDGEAQRAFLPAAGMFALFAIPCFLFVRERRLPRPRVETGTSFARLARSFRRARTEPFGRLLFARFLYIDAIATAIQFTGVYARRTGDFDGDRIDILLAVAAVAAIAGAIGAGFWAERSGPRRVVLSTLVITIGALALTALTGASAMLWVAAPVMGIALGSLSAVDRIFLLRLITPERRGEDFALYAMVGKLSSGFGPLVLWGGTVLVMTELAGLSDFSASRVAVAVLAVAALGGLLVLRPLSDRALEERSTEKGDLACPPRG